MISHFLALYACMPWGVIFTQESCGRKAGLLYLDTLVH